MPWRIASLTIGVIVFSSETASLFMDLLLLAALLSAGAYALKSRDQVAASHCWAAPRAIPDREAHGEPDARLPALPGRRRSERREQIWQLLDSSEQSARRRSSGASPPASPRSTHRGRGSASCPSHCRLRQRFPPRPSTAPVPSDPCARHRRRRGQRPAQSPRRKAFTMSAELFLMQHTCHWFCRSKTVASARMMARHKTSLCAAARIGLGHYPQRLRNDA